MDVHIGAWHGLHLGLGSISEVGGQVDSQILLSHLEVGDGSKHGTIVIIELRSLILQSNELEALSADMAPVKWSLSNKVEHLLMGMRIILNGWTHADDDSPGGIRGENKDGVVDSSELRVNNGLHLMPLVHLQGVVSDRSRQVSSSVSVKAVTIWQLRLVVLTIWLDEGLNMSKRLLNFLLHSVYEREVTLVLLSEESFGSVSSLQISHLF